LTDCAAVAAERARDRRSVPSLRTPEARRAGREGNPVDNDDEGQRDGDAGADADRPERESLEAEDQVGHRMSRGIRVRAQTDPAWGMPDPLRKPPTRHDKRRCDV